MFFKPKKTGINFLCDAIILPQYFNFEREFKDKYPHFKQLSFEQWNMVTAVYFTCAVQTVLQQMELPAYIRLMQRSVNYFETQYPLFRKGLESLLKVYDMKDNNCRLLGTWLAANFLQKTQEKLSPEDINMGQEIASRLFRLANVVDADEIISF